MIAMDEDCGVWLFLGSKTLFQVCPGSTLPRLSPSSAFWISDSDRYYLTNGNLVLYF